MNQLNLGCGYDIREGFINVDSISLEGVDVVHNIENLPLPFQDEYFDFILCQDVLEHTEYIPILKDIHRILKKEGRLEIRVPHFTSVNNYRDPTHKKMFSIFLFDMFVENTLHNRTYYFDFHFLKVEKYQIIFRDNIIYAPISKLVNSNRWWLNFYEYSFLSRIFPADNIKIVLVK